jgi:hypothetical protein
MSHLCAGAFFEIWNDSQKIINQDVEVGVAKPTIGRPTYKVKNTLQLSSTQRNYIENESISAIACYRRIWGKFQCGC